MNVVLKALHDDHTALRPSYAHPTRDLMSRTPDGTYWRSGGTVTFPD